MSHANVVELVGKPLIAEWVQVNFENDLKTLNELRQSVAGLSKLSLLVVEEQFNCNGHFGLNALARKPSADDKITKALISKNWKEFFKKAVSPKVSQGTAYFIENYVCRNKSFLGNSFELFGEFSIQNIESKLNQLNHLESISQQAQEAFGQLNELCGGDFGTTEKFKICEGDSSEKAQAIALLAYVATEIGNVISPFNFRKLESYPLEQYLRMVSDLYDNGVRAELCLGEALTVKIYSNGNIDVKVSNNLISNFLDGILNKTSAPVAG